MINFSKIKNLPNPQNPREIFQIFRAKKIRR